MFQSKEQPTGRYIVFDKKQVTPEFNEEDIYMEWLAWIVLGGLAGWIASMITRNNARMGLLANIILGILGALAGNFLLPMIGVTGLTGFNLYSLLVAIGGAVVILLIVNLFRMNRR